MKITEFGVAIIDRDTHIGKWVLEHRRLDFDQNMFGAISKCINKGDIILDLGANIGSYSFGFWKLVGPDGFIVSVESNPECYNCLEFNLGIYENVETIYGAISDSSHGYDINDIDNNIGAGFIFENKDSENITFTVDSMNFNKLDVIKLDIEGYELKALNGAINTIKKFRPILIIEVNDVTFERNGYNKEDLFKWLTENNYSYRNIYDNENITGVQFDIICFPK